MLVKITEEHFVNPNNVTYAKLVKGRIGATLTIYLVGGDTIQIPVNAEHPDYAANEILGLLN